MSYYHCVEDVGEEVANVLNQFLGESLPDHEDTAFPKPDVVMAMRPLMADYHASLDSEVIQQMSDLARHIEMGSDEDPVEVQGRGLKLARAEFNTTASAFPYRGESVYRWFFIHPDKLDGIADDAAMRAGYVAHWKAEFNRVIKVIETVAMERDNNDDQFYEWEAAIGGEDDDA